MKVKFRLTRNKIILLLIFLAVASSIFYYIFYFPKPITSWNFYDVILTFRIDLREADKIPVYPVEGVVNTEIMNPLVKNITIAFIPSTPQENSYYAVEAFEIATKLYYGYRTLEYEIPNFTAINISSYEGLSGKIQNPIIVLVGPLYANETAVVADPGHVIFIKAKKLQDFDLVTEKFLLAALNIKLD
jgi:hypothetical protein